MSKLFFFQTIQFIISTHVICNRPTDRTLSGTNSRGQRGPASDGNEGVLHIPQSSTITANLPLDCLVSYPGHSFLESYSSAEMQ